MSVFITCPSRNWLASSLEALRNEYGSIYSITTRYVYGDEIEDGKLPFELQSAIETAARNFDPDHDYVLIGGDYVQLVAFIVALTRWHTKFQALRWDKNAEGFLPVWFGTLNEARNIRNLTPTRQP